MKKIGILGSGVVAQTLGAGFLKHGYQVMLGTSDINKLSDWQSRNPDSALASFEQAADFAEIIVLAVKGDAAITVLKSISAESLKGKVLIDTCNPIANEAPENGVLKYFSSINFSLLEDIQKNFPDVNVVKAFNSVGNNLMVNPKFEQGKPSMFICGNNANAKQEVSGILSQFGWDAIDMGAAEAARAIEPLCILWCIPGFINNTWSHAFKLLTK